MIALRAGAGLTGWLCCALCCHAQSSISHGPILGRAGADTMSVWARTTEPGHFRVRYGTAPDALNERSAWITTTPEYDNTGVARLDELQPATTYFYILESEGEPGPGGKFRTWPDPEAVRHPELNPRGLFNFRFEFACGNNQKSTDGGGPGLPTYDTLLAQVMENVDFAILNGDWLYEEKRDFTVEQWLAQVGLPASRTPGQLKITPSITGVWENYKLYLERGTNLAAWHRHVPSYFTYDDHEALNDIYGTDTVGFRDRRAVFRDIAVRAWFDYLAWANPVEHSQVAHFGIAELRAGSDVLIDPQAQFDQLPLEQMANLHVHWCGQQAGILDPEPDPQLADPNHGVHRVVEVLDAHRLRIEPAAVADGQAAYSIGRRTYGSFRVSNCEFFLVDTRSHRDLHDVEHPDKPGLSMLGEQQTEWLMNSIRDSDADFFFVVSSVNFMVPHVGAGGGADLNEVVAKDDAWTVFLEEREKLIAFWDELRQPVFVLTGDLHNSFAIRITDNVWEFASGPHNSVNHRPVEDEGGRPANGTFQYGPRPCEIRWSSYVLSDIERPNRLFPHFCVVQVNNVFNNPLSPGGERWVTFPQPHVIFQYFDGISGELRYSETVHLPQR